MSYARWCKEKEMKNFLKEINITKEVKTGGIPIINDGKTMYIPQRESHSLVIGSTGSGKTQATILPLTKLALLAEESVIINDVKGEIYERTANNFKEKGYNVIVINFDNPNLGSSWNPFTLPYQMYQNNEVDKASKLLDELGYYLFSDTEKKDYDSFWTNSVIDYFTGLSLYLFENAKLEEVNLNSIYALANELDDQKQAEKFLKQLDKNSNIYYNLSGTLKSPIETKGGIISTFNQKMKKYIGLKDLSNMLSTTDFDLKEIANEKTAIYIVSGLNTQSSYLIPLFVSQVINISNEYKTNDRILNVVLDEFDTMIPIKNFASLIKYSRSLGIRFTVVISSYLDLKNMYGDESAEMIKACFPTIIYLISNDIYTLEEISKMCGNREVKDKIQPLISVEELKVMKTFECIILIPRMMPFKTKLFPDYKIDWNLENKELDIPKRKITETSIYNLELK